LRSVRSLVAGLLVVVALSILGAAHVYLARALFVEPGWAAPVPVVGAWAVGLLGVSMLAVPLAERKLGRPLVTWVALPGSLWMGVAFILLVLVGASELVLVWFEPAPGLERLRALTCLAGALLLSAVGVRSAMTPPEIRRVAIEIEGWPAALDGFRIVQISDVHIGPLLGPGFAAEVTRRVLALEPDLVAVTGDLVDGNADRIGGDIAPFGDLRAPHGVYFVTGNHDHLSRVDPWLALISKLGMRVLRNECVTIGSPEACFDLLGVDDYRSDWIGGGRADLDRACAGRVAARPAVLLAHDPTSFKLASGRDIALQISGHTHDGQIWPFRALVRLVVPWVTGLHRVGRAQLYVSRGTGFWGPPLRLGAPAEITELTLSGAPPQGPGVNPRPMCGFPR
jgi:predicted MPP superfamily phosphohydrolase